MSDRDKFCFDCKYFRATTRKTTPVSPTDKGYEMPVNECWRPYRSSYLVDKRDLPIRSTCEEERGGYVIGHKACGEGATFWEPK